eukprot:10137108-Karenia_brevis.AAC.1
MATDQNVEPRGPNNPSQDVNHNGGEPEVPQGLLGGIGSIAEDPLDDPTDEDMLGDAVYIFK